MTDAVKTMSEVANGNYPAGGQVMFEVTRLSTIVEILKIFNPKFLLIKVQ